MDGMKQATKDQKKRMKLAGDHPNAVIVRRQIREKTGETRQVQRARLRADAKEDRSHAAGMKRRHAQKTRVERIRVREAREASGPSGYVLSYLAARTAVGRLRRFRNDAGKLVRLA